MNKNTIIGSVLIGAIMIWWFFMNSANNEAAEKAKLAQKAAAKEAAAQVSDSSAAPSANGLVLPGSTAEVKAAPVLGNSEFGIQNSELNCLAIHPSLYIYRERGNLRCGG